jgi:hypothetical protein
MSFPQASLFFYVCLTLTPQLEPLTPCVDGLYLDPIKIEVNAFTCQAPFTVCLQNPDLLWCAMCMIGLVNWHCGAKMAIFSD